MATPAIIPTANTTINKNVGLSIFHIPSNRQQPFSSPQVTVETSVNQSHSGAVEEQVEACSKSAFLIYSSVMVHSQRCHNGIPQHIYSITPDCKKQGVFEKFNQNGHFNLCQWAEIGEKARNLAFFCAPRGASKGIAWRCMSPGKRL